VRGGFGIFYDRLYNNVFENIRFNAPYFADETFGKFVSGVAAGPLKQPGLLTIPFTSNGQFINPALFPAGLPKPVPRHIDQNLATAYYEQYSFGMQHDLGHNYALELNYIGTLGRKLIGILNRNTYDGRVAGIGSSTRPNQLFNNDNARGNYYGSNYNALNVSLRKNFSAGLSFTANYTYGKALDELSDVFRTKNNAAVSATDVQNIGLDYGPADFDVRHRVVVSYNYDLPFMRNNRWIGGWSLNGIFSWNTGSPIGLFDSLGDPNKDGQRIDRPNFNYQLTANELSSIVGKEQVLPGTTNNAYVYLDQGHFAAATCAPAQAWCNSNIGRNAIPGPMFTNWDFGVSKAFKITESTKLRFDANFFDLFNHPNFQNPNGNFSDPTFGQSQLTYGDTGGHRVTQLALRFDF
jgi:hypothetical protein